MSPGHLGESVAEKSTVDSSVHRNNTWLEKPLTWAVGRLGIIYQAGSLVACPCVLVTVCPGQRLKLSTEFMGWGVTCRAVLVSVAVCAAVLLGCV